MKLKVDKLPDEGRPGDARVEFTPGLNDELPMEERKPAVVPPDDQLDPGPRRGDQGQYLPATYRIKSGIRTDR